MIPLEFMAPTGVGSRVYRPRSTDLAELAPGASLGLDVVCDGIVHGTPFVFPADRAAPTTTQASCERRRTPYLFDARSASWPRTTGWERYTREIADAISQVDPRVRVRVAGSQGVALPALAGLVATPGAVREHADRPLPHPPAGAMGSAAQPWSSHTARPDLVAVAGDREPDGPALLRPPRRGRPRSARYPRRRRQRYGARRGGRALRARPDRCHRRAPRRRTARTRDVPPRQAVSLTVGTLEPRKNMPRLAEAYRLRSAATHDLLVVGRMGWGERPAGLEIVSGLGDAELARLPGATALMMPSLYEGFGLPASRPCSSGCR